MDLILTILAGLVVWRVAVAALSESQACAESPRSAASPPAGQLRPASPQAEPPPAPVPPWELAHVEYEVLDLLRAGNLIGAVYTWQTHTGEGLHAAQAAVKRLGETAGIGAPRG